jgi:hypothetical protein
MIATSSAELLGGTAASRHGAPVVARTVWGPVPRPRDFRLTPVKAWRRLCQDCERRAWMSELRTIIIVGCYCTHAFAPGPAGQVAVGNYPTHSGSESGEARLEKPAQYGFHNENFSSAISVSGLGYREWSSCSGFMSSETLPDAPCQFPKNLGGFGILRWPQQLCVSTAPRSNRRLDCQYAYWS